MINLQLGVSSTTLTDVKENLREIVFEAEHCNIRREIRAQIFRTFPNMLYAESLSR